MTRIGSLLVLLTCWAPATAEDWPQWLGPRRDGSSAEKVAPWKDALKVLWKQPVGEGHSSPVIAGGRVYLHTRVRDTTKENLSAFDAKDGSPQWSRTYDRGNFKSLFGGGPRTRRR